MHTVSMPDENRTVRTPASISAGRLGFSLGFAAIVALPLAVMAMTAPKFLEIFADFGVRLPRATLWVLQVGTSLSHPLALAFMILASVGIAWTVHPFVRKERWALSLWWVLFGGVLLSALAAYLALVYVPLTQMIHAMNAAA